VRLTGISSSVLSEGHAISLWIVVELVGQLAVLLRRPITRSVRVTVFAKLLAELFVVTRDALVLVISIWIVGCSFGICSSSDEL
jgi:hypothetical protein